MLFDYVGAGKSHLAAYGPEKYSPLVGYADDVLALARFLGVSGGIVVGHSASAMIGILADNKAPELFDALVLIGPSPRYTNDGDYVGGFTGEQIEELLEFLDSNHRGWSQAIAPMIMGNADRPELGEELTNSFCWTDPDIEKHFARTTFLADNRADLGPIEARVLILNVARTSSHLRRSGNMFTAQYQAASSSCSTRPGHCPNVSALDATIVAIKAFV